MAITRHLAELILSEHKFREIRGEVLLLGRQLVLMTPDEAQALVEKVGIKPARGAWIDYDKTPHPYPEKLISDASFFSLFCDASVKASDVSSYEEAEIIFDLSAEVPAGLHGHFDFIYNGSVLDNVFDPAACIRNVSRMLKPDGVAFHYEGAQHAAPAYLKFSTDWFFDYYALNGFADFQSYIVTYEDVHIDPWSVYEWDAFISTDEPSKPTMPMPIEQDAMVVAIAQNGPGTTLDRTPLQSLYRSGKHEAYFAAFRRYRDSGRRAAIRDVFSSSSGAAHEQGWFERLLRRSGVGRGYGSVANDVPPGNRLLGTLGSPLFLGRPKKKK
jgi:SAM-dependent methyltransferase